AHTGLRRAGVTLRTEHDVDICPLAEAQRLLRDVLGEATLAERVHEPREIALDPRERDLRLGIAEARVVLEDAPPVSRAHEAGVEDAAVGRAVRDQGFGHRHAPTLETLALGRSVREGLRTRGRHAGLRHELLRVGLGPLDLRGLS